MRDVGWAVFSDGRRSGIAPGTFCREYISESIRWHRSGATLSINSVGKSAWNAALEKTVDR